MKRRRGKEEIEQEKLELSLKQDALASKDERLLEMANMLRAKNEELLTNESAVRCINQMVAAGVIKRDPHGNISMNSHPNLISAGPDDDF